MPTLEYRGVTPADLRLINDALQRGCDVRIHPDKYGVKITSERVKVLRKPEQTVMRGIPGKRE